MENDNSALAELLSEARQNLSNGNAEIARQILNPILAIMPLEPTVNRLSGISNFMLCDVSRAAQQLAISLEMGNYDGDVILLLSLALAALDLDVIADETFSLLPFETSFGEMSYTIASSLHRRKHIQEAQRVCRFAARHGVRDPWFADTGKLYQLIILQRRCGDPDGVASTYASYRVHMPDWDAVEHFLDAVSTHQLDKAKALISTFSSGIHEVLSRCVAEAMLELDCIEHMHESTKISTQFSTNIVTYTVDTVESVAVIENCVLIPHDSIPAQFIGKKDDWNNTPQIIFHHFHEVGGTTMIGALRDIWRGKITTILQDDELKLLEELPEASPETKHLVYAHIYGGLKHLLPPETKSIALLRNPVRRVISSFYWNCREKARGNPLISDYYTRNASLKNWLAGPGLDHIHHNSLANTINFLADKAPLGSRRIAPARSIAETIEIAETTLDFIGITELFDETLFILAYLTGHDTIPRWKRECISFAPNYDDLDSGIINTIKDIVADDIKIFQHFYNKFTTEYRDYINYYKDNMPALEL